MRALSLLALILLITSCAQPATPAGGTSSGIRGTTTVDTGSPITYATPRPQRPFPARLLISPHGMATATVTADSDAQGRFRVPLPPGSYTIRPQNLNDAPVPRAQPVNVTVHPGAWTALDIRFDSGIR